MPLDTQSLVAACLAAATAIFTWFNMQPRYQHHRFFGKEACAVYTIANLLLAAPVLLTGHGIDAAYPRTLVVAQLLGMLLYLAFAIFNVSRTNWALGTMGTVLQTLVFCLLPPVLFCWLALWLCWAVLRIINQSWAASLAALPDTDQWEDTFFEDLKRNRDNEQHLR